jgi:hypothetical protein
MVLVVLVAMANIPPNLDSVLATFMEAHFHSIRTGQSGTVFLWDRLGSSGE